MMNALARPGTVFCSALCERLGGQREEERLALILSLETGSAGLKFAKTPLLRYEKRLTPS